MRIINFARIRRQHLLEMGRARLFNKPWAAGGLLLLCVVVAMLLANIPYVKDIYHAFLHTQLSISIQSPIDAETGRSFIDWIFPKDTKYFRTNSLYLISYFQNGWR